MEFNHVSVLLNECLEGLNIKENGIYVDGTLGGAGHSSEILKRLSKEGRLIGIDQDTDALKAAKERLKDYSNVTFVHSNFSNIENVLKVAINQNFIPVEDDNGTFIGIIKRKDVIQYCSEQLFKK